MTNNNQAPTSADFYFPLRSNVEFFRSSIDYLSLKERIKQASLLFDNLYFEPGAYIANVWPNGDTEFYIPPHELTDDLLNSLRTDFQPTGSDSLFLLQAENSEPLPIFSGEVTRSFYSEFHTTLREISAENYSWIKFGEYKLNDPALRLADRLQRELRPVLDEVAPNAEYYLKRRILTNLSKDLVAISNSKVSASLNALYVPLLQRRAQIPEVQGFHSLQIAVPNFTQVGWDVIADLRNEESLVQFRQKMLALESSVADALSLREYTEAQHQLALSHALIRELLREIENLRPRIGGIVGNTVIDLFIGSIPLVGTAMNAIRNTAIWDEVNKSWFAAFLKLQPPEE